MKREFNGGFHHELLCAIPKEKIKYGNSELLTVATANCQSIYNKIEELLATFIEDKVDICVINETWFNEGEDSKRKLGEVKAILKEAGYIILNIDRPKRGGVVDIICRQNLQIKQIRWFSTGCLGTGSMALNVSQQNSSHNGHLSPT